MKLNEIFTVRNICIKILKAPLSDKISDFYYLILLIFDRKTAGGISF